MIENIDDLKAALGVNDLRRMSSSKVLDLVKMVQKGEVSAAVQSELRLITPETMVKLAQAMDGSVQNAIGSNDRTSDHLYETVAMSKRRYFEIVENPNFTEAERQDARDRIKELDDKLFEHDVNNKRFNLEALKISKEAALGIALVAATGAAFVLPGGRKWLTENGGKLVVDATRKALPGK